MLEVSNIGARIGSHWLWRDVTLSVAAGEVFGILGPNGVGKTTMLRCLANLRKPDQGCITRPNRIGYVAQHFTPSQPITAFDTVAAGLAAQKSLLGRITETDKRAVYASLKQTNADQLADRSITQLSGGERKLVLIARALVTGAKCLILDEPMAGLDLHHQAQILRLFQTLAQSGCVVIWSAHDPNHLLACADKVLLLQKDEEPVIGKPHFVLEPGRLQKMFSLPFCRSDTPMGPQLLPDYR